MRSLLLALVATGCLPQAKNATHAPAREPQSIPNVAATLQKHGLSVTDQKSYIVPLRDGKAEDEMGAFCACRSAAFRKKAHSSSNPHVGQDFNAPPPEKSVALSNGVVIARALLSNSCGYYLDVQDGLGFVWRYLHLNAPAVQVGDVVQQGEIIGNHGEYPKPACGTGAHLHFQRLNAGPLGDSPVYTRGTCGGEPRAICGYDPNVLFTGRTPNTTTTPPPKPIARPTRPVSTLPNCNPRQPSPQPAEEPTAGGRIPSRVTSYITELKAQVTVTPSADGRAVLRVPEVSITTLNGRDESANFCAAEVSPTKETCIAYWQLQFHDGTQWKRLFSDGSARNHPLNFRGEYCLPGPATKKWRYRIVAVTELERTLVHEGEIGDN